MKRIVLAGLIACFGAYGAQAASPKVDSAVKAFGAVSADPAKLKTFCEMTRAMDAIGDKEDAAAEAKITDLMKQLGPDFATAWDVADDLDDDSEDGKAYYAAMDNLAGKCPQ
jgi:hypothetical protein